MQVAVTSIGTVLYFDPNFQRICHAPVAAAPLNLFFTLTEDGLVALIGGLSAQSGSYTVVSVDDIGHVSSDATRARDIFSLHGIDQRGCTALSCGDRYLTAARDGTVRLHGGGADYASPLRLMRIDEVATIRSLLSCRWMLHHNHEVVPAGSVRRIENFELDFGGMRIDLRRAERNLLAREPFQPRAHPGHLAFRYDGWKNAEASRYRPLIYFCAFGPEEIYHCLHIALKSLVTFGGYDGEIMVVTDAPHDGVMGYVPPGLRERVLIRPLRARGPAGYAFARYRLDELGAEDYQPILYMETDVVCDLPVAPLLAKLCLSHGLCGTVEPLSARRPGVGDIDALPPDQADYFGKWLFDDDPHRLDPPLDTVLSSCVLGGRNAARLAPYFQAVRDCFSSYLNRGPAPQKAAALLDQPFYNYVMHKTRAVDTGVLGPAVQFLDSGAPLDAARRKGFFHFQGDFGQFGHKLGPMQEYYALLARTAEAADGPI